MPRPIEVREKQVVQTNNSCDDITNQPKLGSYKKKETRYFWRCLSSPAGLPLEPPYADRAARLGTKQAKGLNA
jgi:hypothetical protein